MKSEIYEELNRIMKKRLSEILSNREKYVEAFIAETGLKPSECELVERNEFDGCTVVQVRKRT